MQGFIHVHWKWQPTPVLLPRKFHGWRSLVSYTPWGHKESDMTEGLHFLSFFIKVINCNVQTYSNVLSVWLSLMERYSKTSCHDNRNFSLKFCHFLFYIFWGCYRFNILNCHNLLGELVILKLCSDTVLLIIVLLLKVNYLGFPGGTSGKEPACQYRRYKRHGFDPFTLALFVLFS